jgi:hypothetical protein
MTNKRKKPAARKPSTALVVRRRVPVSRRLLPARRPVKTEENLERQIKRLEALTSGGVLDDAIQLGDFGLVEVKFTREEEAVLSEPVRLEDIRVKPTGQVYLPHIVYTRWLNRAFGRTGWALRPASKPLINNNSVVVPYLLLVHGKPLAFALGEQDYFANNPDQSYGDALESTVASGLRRCCKHLGLALELWERSFGEMFIAEHCVRVKTETERDGQRKVKWFVRRKTDAPFWNEIQTGRRAVDASEPVAPARAVPPASHHSTSGKAISEARVKRLWTIIRSRGRSDAEVKAYLESLGFTSSKLITTDLYETICAAIEHPGPLPIVVGREPGEEG